MGRHLTRKKRARMSCFSYLLLDQRSQWQVIKQICESLPDVGVAILAQALIIEAIDLCDLARLVVATENGDTILVADLECHQQGHSLDRVVATVHIVAHEQIVGVRRIAANAEQLHQVVELAVDVTADRDRATDRLDIGLLHQDLASLCFFIHIYELDVSFWPGKRVYQFLRLL